MNIFVPWSNLKANTVRSWLSRISHEWNRRFPRKLLQCSQLRKKERSKSPRRLGSTSSALFPSCKSRKVQVDFNGGNISGDSVFGPYSRASRDVSSLSCEMRANTLYSVKGVRGGLITSGEGSREESLPHSGRPEGQGPGDGTAAIPPFRQFEVRTNHLRRGLFMRYGAVQGQYAVHCPSRGRVGAPGRISGELSRCNAGISNDMNSINNCNSSSLRASTGVR